MNAARVIVVGGGASGVILAARLLSSPNPRLRVAVVEKRSEIGAGIAYGTDEPVHLLNTRAGSMSALVEDPEHFWRWLRESGLAEQLGCADPFCFVPRCLYRDYLRDLVKPWSAEAGDGRLQVVEGECVGIRETAGGIAVELSDGRLEIGAAAVLATGHSNPTSGPQAPYSGPWCSPDELGIKPSEEVVILGTGLSMVDNVVQLQRAGHSGRVTALSRRGLLPRIHAPSTPMKLDPADVPFGTGISFLLHWLRETIRWTEARGGDWRDVVDGIRPHTQTLWQSLSPDAKARFLRHARTFWEVHRHRLPPQADRSLRDSLAEGRLSLVAGRLRRLEADGGRKILHVTLRGGGEQALAADHVIDCTGILRDPTAEDGSLAARLVERGSARLDSLRIGIEVDADCAVIDAKGRASSRLFAVGPVTRARFWEMTAIPDIRIQCADLAEALHRRLDVNAGEGRSSDWLSL